MIASVMVMKISKANIDSSKSIGFSNGSNSKSHNSNGGGGRGSDSSMHRNDICKGSNLVAVDSQTNHA